MGVLRGDRPLGALLTGMNQPQLERSPTDTRRALASSSVPVGPAAKRPPRAPTGGGTAGSAAAISGGVDPVSLLRHVEKETAGARLHTRPRLRPAARSETCSHSWHCVVVTRLRGAGSICAADFFPLGAAQMLEPFLASAGFGRFAIRTDPLCAQATALVNTESIEVRGCTAGSGSAAAVSHAQPRPAL